VAIGLRVQGARQRAGEAAALAAWLQAFRQAVVEAEAATVIALPHQSRAGLPGLAGPCLPELTDAEFVHTAAEIVLGRGCPPAELARWCAELQNGRHGRHALLAAMLADALTVQKRDGDRQARAEHVFHVMGTGERVTWADWKARASARAQSPAPAPAPFPWRLAGPPRVRISAITSLYRGGAHTERFLANMVSQTSFRDHAELIIVDANSPDGERAVIERYQRDWPQIRYLHVNHRIGIYDAWNIAVQTARGDYLTSANIDDLRRSDSLERQACVLEELPFVDVVYQDFYYTMDPDLPFDRIAAVGYKSDLPLVTPQGLMKLNPPHNAPMWRRRLHDELGLFDASFVSAGDYEFWMRCVVAGKTFYKLNDPHVAYYQNPEGLSTRPDTPGHEETRLVHKRYGRRLVSELLGIALDRFGATLGLGSDARHGVASHAALVEVALRGAALTLQPDVAA
jgi:GT2 family glycosyltransferase